MDDEKLVLPNPINMPPIGQISIYMQEKAVNRPTEI